MRKKRGLFSTLNKRRRRWIHEIKAKHRRRTFGNKPVVGITGSVGKTTLTGLLHHLLDQNSDTLVSMEGNTIEGIIDSLRLLDAKHNRAVFEVGTGGPGDIANCTNMLRPNVGVITCVSSDHYSAFRSEEATAQEKGTLARSLPDDGLLLLNLDDEHVRQMGALTAARTVTFGQSEEADYQFLNTDQQSSSGVAFTLRHGKRDVDFHVAVLGKHLVPSLVGAIACAHQLGVDWEVLVDRARGFGGISARCSVHQMPGRPIFIDDSTKAPLGTAAMPFALLGDFVAPRKTIVIGQLSDYRGAQNRAYRQVCIEADKYADRIIVLSRTAKYLRKGKELAEDTELCTFESWRDLANLLENSMVPDEVIFLKSANNYHLSRVVLNEVEPVTCNRMICSATFLCRSCTFLRNEDLSKSTAAPRTWPRDNPYQHESPPAPQGLSQGKRF